MKLVIDLVRNIPWGKAQDLTFIIRLDHQLRSKLWSFATDRLRAARDPVKSRIDGHVL